MSEKVIVRLNRRFEMGVWAVNPNQRDSDEFEQVERLNELTPYGMLLVSVASCTAQVVHSYARHHGVPLMEVELREVYKRNYKQDCDDCENIDRYEEHIEEQIAFSGDLDADEREKLFKIAHQCPIVKMFETGIDIRSEQVEPSEVRRLIK